MPEVQDSAELRRIIDIPRREWTPAQAQDLAQRLTVALRRPEIAPRDPGTACGACGAQAGEPCRPMTLRPLQAIALAEIAQWGGAFVPIPVGGGKAQPNTEPVLLDRGWTPIGDVRVGDRIVGSDGRLHNVTGVHPQGVRPVWRVTFSDRTWALCDPDHLWTFKGAGPKGLKTRTRTLREWSREALTRPCGAHKAHRLFLPMLAGPVAATPADLPLDPYTLGALLGDGSFRPGGPSFTSMDREIADALVLPEGVFLVPTASQNCGRATQYRITGGRRGGRPSPLVDALRGLGLWGLGSSEKFVPEAYMRAAPDQRAALLRGLLDTDGECTAAGRVLFASKSERLADDVACLVESLGGSATRIQRSNHWRVSVRLPADVRPFLCERKAARYRPDQRQRSPGRAVVAIEDTGRVEPMTCLSVDAPDRLYVTRFHVLTHNTLVDLLAPRMRPEVERPLILVPAHLRPDMARAEHAYRRHWILPTFYRVESYQTLSRVGAADFLDQYRPDMVIADEGDYLKNPSAAVTKRVARYLRARWKEGRPVVYVDLTGTPADSSIREYAHRTSWALRRTNPTPEDWSTLDEWARALDVGVSDLRRMEPGALERLCAPGEDVPEAYQRRLRQSPGVIMAGDDPLPIPLEIVSHVVALDAAQRAKMADLRAGNCPDGVPWADGVEAWRHAREIATGFYSVWTPRPPDDWRDARRDWASICREVLSNNRRNLDSEQQLCQYLDAHPDDYPHAQTALARWREIEPTFTPNPIAHWISDHVIDWIAAWARRAPGLIWTDRPAVGERLAQRHGLPFYSNDGIDARTGRFVMDHAAAEGSIVLGRRSNDSGRNLQFQWSRNLVVDVPPGGRAWEQMLGRTHRPGQRADRVTVEVLFGCIEDAEAFRRARARSAWAQTMSGYSRKLCRADVSGVVSPERAALLDGPAWKKTTPAP